MELTKSGPDLDWTPDNGLPQRYKLWWQQKCNLLFDTVLREKSEEYKCKLLLCYYGDRELELFNSWTLTTAQHKILKNYWDNLKLM